MNIEETENEFIINLFAPALKKENISIFTQNDILSVRYKAEEGDSSLRFTRKEYRREEISRSFELKGKVDIEKIRASYTEGVLKIELPKTEAAKRPMQDIPVS
ncbi:MAG TPA: Hsp20/alpha crystallin family protein [Puia sp.]